MSSNKVEWLYKKYERLLISIISKHLDNQEDIEDCLQDVFVYFLQHKEKIKHSTHNQVKNYLATIANGMAINKYKRNMREIVVDDCENINDFNEYSSNDIFNSISTSELASIIDKLNEKDKNFIYLTYIYGYNSEEISQMYGIKSSYVRKHLQRAKEFLRGELNEKE